MYNLKVLMAYKGNYHKNENLERSKFFNCKVYLQIFEETFYYQKYIKQNSFKGPLSGLRQLLTTESTLKMIKNAF